MDKPFFLSWRIRAATRCASSGKFAIIRGMKPIATDNYDFERLMSDGSVKVAHQSGHESVEGGRKVAR